MLAHSRATKATEGHLGYRSLPFCSLPAAEIRKFVMGKCPGANAGWCLGSGVHPLPRARWSY